MSNELISIEKMPNLRDMKVSNIEESIEYWKAQKGDEKYCIFMDINASTVVDRLTGEEKQLDHAIFLEQKEDGTLQKYKQASWRLVSALEGFEPGQAFYVLNEGKDDKNSDLWQVRKLTPPNGKK